jgi:hypothetical protein
MIRNSILLRTNTTCTVRAKKCRAAVALNVTAHPANGHPRAVGGDAAWLVEESRVADATAGPSRQAGLTEQASVPQTRNFPTCEFLQALQHDALKQLPRTIPIHRIAVEYRYTGAANRPRL